MPNFEELGLKISCKQDDPNLHMSVLSYGALRERQIAYSERLVSDYLLPDLFPGQQAHVLRFDSQSGFSISPWNTTPKGNTTLSNCTSLNIFGDTGESLTTHQNLRVLLENSERKRQFEQALKAKVAETKRDLLFVVAGGMYCTPEMAEIVALHTGESASALKKNIAKGKVPQTYTDGIEYLQEMVRNLFGREIHAVVSPSIVPFPSDIVVDGKSRRMYVIKPRQPIQLVDKITAPDKITAHLASL